MYTLSALLALYAENPLYNGGFPAQRSRNTEVWRFLCCYSNKTILLSYVHITMWWCQWVIYKETTGFPTCLPFQWYEHKQNLHQSTKMKHECAHNSCNTPYKTYRWVKSKKDVTPVYWQQSYVFLALPHRYETWFPDNCLIHSLSLFWKNKANLRDVIAATGPVILLKLDSNRWFFSPCDLEIWWMTSKNYRAPLLHYIKLCASSQTPRWIQTGVTVRKRSKSAIFCPVWPWNSMDDLEKQ